MWKTTWTRLPHTSQPTIPVGLLASSARYTRRSNASASPLLYQLRPEIGPDARLAVVGRYVILFPFAKDVVYIERIVYGGRDLPPIFEQ